MEGRYIRTNPAYHPGLTDSTGSREEFQRIVNAEEALLFGGWPAWQLTRQNSRLAGFEPSPRPAAFEPLGVDDLDVLLPAEVLVRVVRGAGHPDGRNLTGWTFEQYESYRSGQDVSSSALYNEMKTLKRARRVPGTDRGRR